MKTYLTLIFLFIGAFIFGQSFDFNPFYICALDVASGKELMSQCSRNSPPNVKKISMVGDSVLKLISEGFDKIKIQKTFNGEQITELHDYAYQVIEIEINEKKFVYINAFRIGKSGPDMEGNHKDWRRKSVKACDGGKSFWGILFDLKTKEFSELAINGSS